MKIESSYFTTSHTIRRFTVKVLLTVGMCTLVGCSSPLVRPDIDATTDARIAATPNAAPTRTITNFTQSLRCMDEKLLQYGISGLLIGAQEVRDPASDVTGTTDMLMTSLSTMSRKSKAFGIVSLSSDLSDVAQYHNLHGNQTFRSPDFFIRLSAPQIDKGVQTNQAGGGVGVLDGVEAQYSRDRIASVISLDMNLGTVGNLQLLPGVYSSNSIAVLRKGSATDLSGEIQKLGAVFRITDDNSEGFHHSIRTLIELGTIEIVGRLTQTPYWECLDIESNNPAVQSQVKDWYVGLTDSDRITFTQSKLSAIGLYTGKVDGEESPALRTAIALYKTQQGLIADGEIDFLLYYNLIADETPVAAEHVALLQPTFTAVGDASSEKPLVDLETVQLTPLDFSFKTNKAGTNNVFKQGELVELEVKLTTDANVFCYYQQGDGRVVKLFPNRFRPESRVAAGSNTQIPGSDGFQIVTDSAGKTERVMCMASYDDIESRLPGLFREKDLVPLPVESLEQISGYYRSVASTIPLVETIELKVVK